MCETETGKLKLPELSEHERLAEVMDGWTQ